MFCTLNGIRFSKPSKRSSASMTGSAMRRTLMGDILVQVRQNKRMRGGMHPPRISHGSLSSRHWDEPCGEGTSFFEVTCRAEHTFSSYTTLDKTFLQPTVASGRELRKASRVK